MNRYQIATYQISLQNKTRTVFHFPKTPYIATTVQYIEYGFDNNGICLLDNIQSSIIYSAITQISKEYDCAIVMEKKSEAELTTICYSHQINSLELLPQNKSVLCYNCMDFQLPSYYNTIGIVYNYRNNFKFV